GPTIPEQEPNDTPPKAQALVPPAGIEGRIGGPKDVDLYRLSIAPPARQTLHVELTAVPGIDFALDVPDSSNARVVGVNDGKAGEAEILTAVTLSPGSYFVRVREVHGKLDQPPSPTSYLLSWRVSAQDPRSEDEPNDKSALATPLALGEE